MSKYTQLPECFEYHEKSELRGRPGYYPNINSDQLKAASELIAAIEKENLRFNVDEENEFLKLCRFLRARKWSVPQALHMIKEDIKWRSEENRLNLRSETAEEVLGCDVGSLYRYFPTWIQGRDKQMRPVSYRQFGKFEIWNVLKLTSMQRLVRFHAWETEQALRFMHAKSRAENVNIETFVLVIDAAGWNVHLATRDAFTFIKGMASTDSDHYPERLGSLVVINAPTALAWAWGVVQGFLDQVTKSKIKIIGSNRAEWLPVLLELIDEDQIPQQYGGKAEDLPPDQAILQMNPTFEFPDEKGVDGTTKKKKPLMVTLDQGTQTDDPIDLLEDLEAARCRCTIN